ncbi:MAG: hypothetical protein BWK77_04510 [Verrucomicrobia bacterium A1]|nr:MAG: hypothetical protein BWK77_04510 [Verrucomicrobia bacterium A1]
MIQALQDNEWLLQPPRRGGHAAMAWGAVLASAALHWLAAVELPLFKLGASAALPQPPKRVPVVVQSVVRIPSAPVPDRPPEFSPGRPDASFARPAPKEFITALDPALLQPSTMPPELAGDRSPVRLPEPPPDRIEWQPRQARIEITRQMAREDPVAPPRRLSAAIERVPLAADLIAPSPPPVSPAPVSAGPPSLHGSGLFALRAEGPAGALPQARLAPPPEMGHPVPIREAGAVMTERGADITGVKPIEHLLRLDLRTHVPADEAAWLYFSLAIRRAGDNVLPVLPRDVFLIQDCSSSMTTPKVEACKRGLHAALRTLSPRDRFDIMSFRDRVARCFGEWTDASPTARARAGWFIEQMESSGMTDVFGALDALKGIGGDPGRPLVAMMISDGRPTIGLQDNFEIIQRYSDSNEGRVSVFSFGGGSGVNRFLLDFLSYKNRGESRIVRDNTALPEGIEAFAREVSRPVLANLEYRFSGLERTEVYPHLLTHLYLDRPLVLYGRVPAGTPSTAVRIAGWSGAGAHDMVFPVDWAAGTEGGSDLRNDWVRQKLSWLVGEHIRTRDPAFRAAAIKLARSVGPSMPYAVELGVPDAPVRVN